MTQIFIGYPYTLDTFFDGTNSNDLIIAPSDDSKIFIGPSNAENYITIESNGTKISEVLDIGQDSEFNVEYTNPNCLLRVRPLSSNVNSNGGVEIGSISGNTPYIAANQGVGSDGSTINTYGLSFRTSNETRMVITNDGQVIPSENNTYNLGTDSFRWETGYFNDVNALYGLYRNGNNFTSFANAQLAFGFDGTSNYKHCIQTRHDANSDTNNNAFDFLLWQTSDDASSNGTKRVMTVGSASIEITNALNINTAAERATPFFSAYNSNLDSTDWFEFSYGRSAANKDAGMYQFRPSSNAAGGDDALVNLGFYGIATLTYTAAGDVFPSTDNVSECGTSGKRWSVVYAVNGTIQTSDDRVKSDEVYLSNALDTMDKLKPQTYTKWNSMDYLTDSNAWSIRESGLIVQEVFYDTPELRHLIHLSDDADSNVLYTSNIASSSDPSVDPDYSAWGSVTAGINYAGLVPYLVQSVKELKSMIDSKDVTIATMMNEISNLTARMDAL